jgi:hypothetical protein
VGAKLISVLKTHLVTQPSYQVFWRQPHDLETIHTHPCHKGVVTLSLWGYSFRNLLLVRDELKLQRYHSNHSGGTRECRALIKSMFIRKTCNLPPEAWEPRSFISWSMRWFNSSTEIKPITHNYTFHLPQKMAIITIIIHVVVSTVVGVISFKLAGPSWRDFQVLFNIRLFHF